MSSRTRLALALPALAGLAALLVWASVGLPRFGDYRGPYGDVIDRVATPERHMTNAVTAVVFDFRGFDTMGEEFILFSAVVGITLLLRDEDEGRPDELDDAVGSDGVRVGGILAVGVALLVALWLIAFGFVTPGGGFQGGVALASGLLLVFLVASHGAWSGVQSETVLDPLEGIGAGGYVVVGLAALIGGSPFLANVLGPGVSGTVWSGGSAAIVNWAAGVEVAAATLLLFARFIDQYIVPLEAS